MKTVKENLKTLFDFIAANTKVKTFSTTPIKGFEVKIDYVYCFNPAWGTDYEILNIEVKISKELKTLEKFLNIDFTRTVEDGDLNDIIPTKEFNNISDQFDKLRSVFDEHILDHVGDISEVKNFTECWKYVEKYLKEKENPSNIRVKINDDYTATAKRGDKNIKVGCQTIPIDSIKLLLNEIEKLNA